MTKVTLLGAEQAPLLARSHYRDDGSASPIVAALAQVPELLDVTIPFVGRVLGETAMDVRTKEVVILRLSALNGCRYCTQTHTVAAWEAGLTPAQTAKLCGSPGALESRERALVAWCDAFNSTPADIPEPVSATLRKHFDEHEIVELALVAAATIMLNRLCSGLELPTSPATLARLEQAGAL
jgi:AhpD family alkylhydroperoxidase